MTGLVACINNITEYIEYQTFVKANEISEVRYLWINFDLPCSIEGVYTYINASLFHASSVESLSDTMHSESIFFILSERNFYIKKKSEIVNKTCIFAQTFSILRISKIKNIESEPVTRLSAIISLYNCEKYIDNLFQEIQKQTIMEETEWLIGYFPASFPSELSRNTFRNTLIVYLRKLSNVKVFEFFNTDMNLYALWNFLLKQASSPYITSFHPDDIRSKSWGETCVSYLDTHEDIGLVTPVYYPFNEDCLPTSFGKEKPWFLRRYQFYRVTEDEGEVITSFTYEECEDENEFSSKDLFSVDKDFQIVPYDIPNASPVWRKSLHRNQHFFDETENIPADLVMWLFFGSICKMVQLINCKVWFRISDQQLHRKHFFVKDTWESLIKKYACQEMIDYVNNVTK